MNRRGILEHTWEQQSTPLGCTERCLQSGEKDSHCAKPEAPAREIVLCSGSKTKVTEEKERVKVFIDGYKNVRSRKEMLGLSSNKMKIQSEISRIRITNTVKSRVFFLIFVWLPFLILITEIRNEHSFIHACISSFIPMRTYCGLLTVLGF